MKKSINVLFFNFTGESIFKDKILEKVELDYEVRVLNTSNQKEASLFLDQSPKTVFVFNAHTTAEYMRARSVLSNYRDRHKKSLYSIGVLGTVNDQIIGSLKNLGCKRIFDQSAKPIEVAKIIRQSDEKKSSYRMFELPKSVLAVKVESKSGAEVSCLLDSIDENSLLVELEGVNDYVPGDRIKLNVVFEYENYKVDLMIDGLIENVEETDQPQISMLNMNLSSEESTSLENFMVLYDKKQQKVHEFMRLAKGA